MNKAVLPLLAHRFFFLVLRMYVWMVFPSSEIFIYAWDNTAAYSVRVRVLRWKKCEYLTIDQCRCWWPR